MTGTATEPSDLASRYGRTPARRSRRRVIAIAAVVAFAIVLGAWVWWVGLLAPTASIEVDTTGYSHGDDSVIVTYQLTVDTGTPVRCAVEALDEHFGVVGWKVVDLPASQQRVRNLSAEVRITQPATTGLISSCWTA